MFRLSASFSFCLLFSVVASGQGYKPPIAQASKDAELAIQGFVLPEGMTGTLLAAEPALANPVAFYATNDGRVFVCETFRQEIGVEDNRNHMNWLNNDLRLESVEERLAMFRKYLGADVAKYSTEHDRIRVLQDTNGDGRLDSDSVFASGFNDIADGTGAGVIEHNGNVYYTCIPRLWMLKDTNGDGTVDEQEVLHHGYGVRVAFRGHDMHGLTVGPDGRLYFSIGDRGYNVITKEGTRLKRPDTGAVFRCDMDGSHLEVFAYGLRNPQELAFDDYGNLWTGDNNSDSGDMARWVYVVQDGDTGWRMYFQYLEDRGPWNRERMWYPYRSDEKTAAVQPAYIVPPVANLADGPSGLTCYPGLGLSERYRNHFFMADFRGTAGISGIRSFSVKPRGATFELTDSHEFIWSILGTDVDFAPDGSLYVTDWVNGWSGEGKGRLYRFADNENISAVTGANVPQLLGGGIAKAETGELFGYLAHADRRVRQMAQFELVRRSRDTDSAEKTRRDIFAAAALPGDDVTHRHLAWALWQLGLESSESARGVVELCERGGLTAHAELGVQYTKILADLVSRHGISEIMSDSQRDSLRKTLTGLTKSKDLRHTGFAAVTLGTTGRAADVQPLFDLLERNSNNDPVLRHQAIMGLVKLGERDPAALLVRNPQKQPAAIRLGLVVALGRLKRKEVIQLLDDSDPAVAAEVARVISEHGTPAALDRLSGSLTAAYNDPKQPLSSVITRHALEACYRLGSKRHANMVARFAATTDCPDELRLVAAKMLYTWNTPQQTDTVTGRWRPISQRDIDGLDRALRSELPAILAGPKGVRELGAKTAARLKVKEAVPSLQKMFDNKETDEATRVAAFRALVRLSDDVDGLLAHGRKDSLEAIRVAALELLAEKRPDFAIPALTATVTTGSVKAKQQALQLLAGIGNEPAAAALVRAFDSFSAGNLPAAVALDVLQAAEVVGSRELMTRVETFRRKQASAGTKTAAWSECLEGGDAARGKIIFFGRAAASCRRCHKVNGDGADVGPDLSAVAKNKDRNYLLEAIVDPNAKIAKGFETTIIVDLDGRIHSGIIKEENDSVVKLMTPKGATITVAKEDIEERAKGQSGMPSDIAKNMSRSEVRDLVEYLSTLTVAADAGVHGKPVSE